MKKLAKAVVLTGIVYVLPLSGSLDMLLCAPLLLALAGALTLLVSQPDFSGKEATVNKSTDRGSVVTILLAGLFAHIVAVVEWRWRGFPGASGWLEATQLVGVALVCAGLAIRISSIRVLGAFFTSTVQIQGNHRLVTAGPYAKVRHPSYLGALIAIMGHALVLGAPTSAGLSVLVMLAVYRHRVMVEEAALRRAFGDSYTSYATRTHRLIPYVW